MRNLYSIPGVTSLRVVLQYSFSSFSNAIKAGSPVLYNASSIFSFPGAHTQQLQTPLPLYNKPACLYLSAISFVIINQVPYLNNIMECPAAVTQQQGGLLS